MTDYLNQVSQLGSQGDYYLVIAIISIITNFLEVENKVVHLLFSFMLCLEYYLNDYVNCSKCS